MTKLKILDNYKSEMNVNEIKLSDYKTVMSTNSDQYISLDYENGKANEN